MTRRRPGLSVTSMLLSGRNAMLHGFSSPRTRTDTRIFCPSPVAYSTGPAGKAFPASPVGATGMPFVNGTFCCPISDAPVAIRARINSEANQTDFDKCRLLTAQPPSRQSVYYDRRRNRRADAETEELKMSACPRAFLREGALRPLRT